MSSEELLRRQQRIMSGLQETSDYLDKGYKENMKEQCNVFDKQDNRYFATNIKNILAERHFYDFPEILLQEFTGIDSQSVEKFLAQTVDGFWNNIVENISRNFQWFSLKYSYHFLVVSR